MCLLQKAHKCDFVVLLLKSERFINLFRKCVPEFEIKFDHLFVTISVFTCEYLCGLL